MKKFIPNFLSFIRIPLSLLMFICLNSPYIITGLYFACGISDMFDGFFARLFKTASAFGAKLDSIADAVFFCVIVTISPFLIKFDIALILTAATVAIVRLFNLLLTRNKFGRWGIIHTTANKTAGFVLFIFYPLCVYYGYAPLWVVAAAGSVTFFSALEECLLLFSLKSYNADIKSIFCCHAKQHF